MAYGNCRFVERRGLSALIARLPLLRQWVRPLVLSQFLLVLGRFLRVRAPMPEALKRAGGMGQGSILHDLGQRAARGVQQGLSLSQALEGEALMPEGLCQMIRLAENNETLPQRCLDLAQNLRERWFFRAQRLVRIVEPLALLGVGLLVAAIAAAFYLPLFNLSVAMTQKMFE
jgi:type II secretory pathway component PulF